MKKRLLVSLLSLMFLSFCEAQDSTAIAALKDSVSAQHYNFSAQTMIPAIGGSKSLSGGYELRISKDKINCYLPYAGKSYTVDYGSTKGPLDFTSTEFNYTADPDNKGGWNVVIKPKGGNDVREMRLDIYDNGTGYLNVTFNNRQSISFNGYVTTGQKN